MNEPIFVRGMSRSGGTLVVTLLDAHPQISMIYEFYPNQLDTAGANCTIDIERVITSLETARNMKSAIAAMPTDGLKKLVARAPRACMDQKSLAGLIRQHFEEKQSFETPGERLRFVERCGRHKMAIEEKPRWGAKCGTNFMDYAETWPRAKFINVVRDGRDVLASQLNTGDFKTTPTSLGHSWAQNHTRFRNLMRSGELQGFELIYERLVREPSDEVHRLLEFLEVEPDPSILDYHNRNLNIFAVGHMSLGALRQPVNASQVGRWRKDLSEAQVEAFLTEAGQAMAEFGYLD